MEDSGVLPARESEKSNRQRSMLTVLRARTTRRGKAQIRNDMIGRENLGFPVEGSVGRLPVRVERWLVVEGRLISEGWLVVERRLLSEGGLVLEGRLRSKGGLLLEGGRGFVALAAWLGELALDG